MRFSGPPRSSSCDHFYFFSDNRITWMGSEIFENLKIPSFRKFRRFLCCHLQSHCIYFTLTLLQYLDAHVTSRDLLFIKNYYDPNFYTVFGLARQLSIKNQKKISKILGQKVIRSDFRLERKSCVEKWNLGTHQFKSHLHFSTLGAFNLFSGQKLNFWSDFWNERINVL